MQTPKQGGTSLPPPSPSRSDPLQPYEQQQLRTLINQFEATPERIRAAFLAHVAPGTVVPLRRRAH